VKPLTQREAISISKDNQEDVKALVKNNPKVTIQKQTEEVKEASTKPSFKGPNFNPLLRNQPVSMPKEDLKIESIK
jgi:hypothetical protein